MASCVTRALVSASEARRASEDLMTRGCLPAGADIQRKGATSGEVGEARDSKEGSGVSWTTGGPRD